MALNFIIGVFFGVLSAVVPGLGPFTGSILALNLTGNNATAALTAYIVALVMGTYKEAFAPGVSGTVEATHMVELNNADSIKLANLVIGLKLFILLVVPTVCWYFFSPNLAGFTPLSIGKGLLVYPLIAAWYFYKEGFRFIVLIVPYVLSFWLIQSDLNAVYVIGASMIILPAMCNNYVTKTERTDEVTDAYTETSLAEESLDWAGQCLIGIAYLGLFLGISPSGVSGGITSTTVRGNAIVAIQHFAMECGIIALFICGVFNGRTGVGIVVAKTQFVTIELVVSCVLVLTIVHLLLGNWLCKYWVFMVSTPVMYKLAKLVGIAIVAMTLAYCGWQGFAIFGLVMVWPAIWWRIGRLRGTEYKRYVYLVPFTFNI